MKISIKSFIKSGKFGPVQIGMRREAVISHLGEPDGRIAVTEPQTGIAYGRYEFFFDEAGRLYAIQNDNFNPRYPELTHYRNEHFQIDPWFIGATTAITLGEVEKMLAAEATPFRRIEYWGRTVIKIESSDMIIDFDGDIADIRQKSLTGIRLWKTHAWLIHCQGDSTRQY